MSSESMNSLKYSVLGMNWDNTYWGWKTMSELHYLVLRKVSRDVTVCACKLQIIYTQNKNKLKRLHYMAMDAQRKWEQADRAKTQSSTIFQNWLKDWSLQRHLREPRSLSLHLDITRTVVHQAQMTSQGPAGIEG